jgi:uncharacterized protein YndB with AHSA1/START domain
MSGLFVNMQLDVDAPAESVWRVLTDNEFIPQYMFGCRAQTDWKPGSPLLWYGVADGKLYVKGTVTTFEAPHLLEYTVIDPNSEIADVPENYLDMRFVVKPRGEHGSTLEVSQGDFAKVANGQKRYQDTQGGNDFVLQGIRKVAESLVTAK